MLWPFVPSSAAETLQFATFVGQKQDAEWRRALRAGEQQFEFAYQKDAARATKMEWLIRANTSATWELPLWHEFSQNVAIASGATSINVETNAEYYAGGKAAIIADDDTHEVVSISAIGSGVINLTAGVVGSYASASVCPVKEAILPGGLGKNTRYAVQPLSASFVCTQELTSPTSPFSALGGFDLVTDGPSATSPYEGDVAQELDYFESGGGAYELVERETYVRRSSAVEFSDAIAAQRWRRKQWLYHVQGRHRPFWMPSFVGDIALTAPVGSTDTTITVEAFSPDASALVGRAIYFADAGLGRIITSAGTASGTHTLGIAALGQAYPQTGMVCQAPLVRFATDRFEISHERIHENFLSRFRAPIIEVLG